MTTKSKFCPWCGALLRATTKVCPKCAAAIMPQTPDVDIPGLTRVSDELAAEAASCDARLAERHVPRLVARLMDV